MFRNHVTNEKVDAGRNTELLMVTLMGPRLISSARRTLATTSFLTCFSYRLR
jgi:hypothetical protein